MSSPPNRTKFQSKCLSARQSREQFLNLILILGGQVIRLHRAAQIRIAGQRRRLGPQLVKRRKREHPRSQCRRTMPARTRTSASRARLSSSRSQSWSCRRPPSRWQTRCRKSQQRSEARRRRPRSQPRSRRQSETSMIQAKTSPSRQASAWPISQSRSKRALERRKASTSCPIRHST